jgi:pyruvate,water dikinase
MGEMELANPRWHEESASVEQLLYKHASGVGDSSDHLFKQAQKRRVRAETRLPKMLAAHGASSLVESIQEDLAVVKQLLPYREIGKHYLMEGYDLIRQVIQSLADRLQLGKDIYFLDLKELHRCGAGLPLADSVEPSMLTEQRRFQWQVLQRVSLPDFVDANSLEHVQRRIPVAGDEGWIDATALSNGVARGPIVRLDDHDSADVRRTGYVLVCTALDSGLTALMSGACALVVQRGGILSHGAAVARQLGIPAVALANLRFEGAKWLVVDGSRGRVKMERGA